jgi:hypothetical protein
MKVYIVYLWNENMQEILNVYSNLEDAQKCVEVLQKSATSCSFSIIEREVIE